MGVRVWGLGSRVWGLGSGVWGLGYRARGFADERVTWANGGDGSGIRQSKKWEIAEVGHPALNWRRTGTEDSQATGNIFRGPVSNPLWGGTGVG
jgi:hypothetical protein